MHVATLYDLHGNLRALEAVLHEIPAEATIVVGGDACAGGIYASETGNDLDIFTERTPEARIEGLFGDVDADVVVCGHTHTQFERTVAGKRVINSGSVGMPYEDAPGAYWTFDLGHRHTGYDGAEPPKVGREQAISHFESLERGD